MDIEWVFCTIHHHAPITAGQSSFILFGQHSILAGFIFIILLHLADLSLSPRTLTFQYVLVLFCPNYMHVEPT